MRFIVSCFGSIAVILVPFARVRMFLRPTRDVISPPPSDVFSFWVVGNIYRNYYDGSPGKLAGGILPNGRKHGLLVYATCNYYTACLITDPSPPAEDFRNGEFTIPPKDHVLFTNT